MSKHRIFLGFMAISAIASFVSWLNYDPLSRWVAFFAWSGPLVLLSTGLLLEQTKHSLLTRGSSFEGTTHMSLGLCLAALAVPMHLVALSDYPFMAIGDQIRDSGLRPSSLFYNRSLDMFAQDWSQTLFFATWLSFLVPLWPTDVLLYRSVGAAIGLVTVFALFYLTVPRIGLVAAFVAACCAACSPAHIFFARTEPLISCSELLSTLAMTTCFATVRSEAKGLRSGFALLGLLVGLSFVLHASARAPAILCLLITSLVFLWRHRQDPRNAMRDMTAHLSMALLLAVATMGPYLPKVTWEYLIGPGLADSVGGTSFTTFLHDVYDRYLATVGVLFAAPLQIHFHGQVLTPKIVTFIMLVGTLSAFARRSAEGIICLVLLAGIFFLNSAMSPNFNAGHRLMVALPPIWILAGLGVSALVDWFVACGARRAVCSLLLPSILVLPVLHDAYTFFVSDRASTIEYKYFRQRLYKTLRHIVEDPDIRAKVRPVSSICLFGKQDSVVAHELELLHIAEFFSFFFPHAHYQARSSGAITDEDVVIVSPACNEISPGLLRAREFDCAGKPEWRCPGPEAVLRVLVQE